MDLSRAKTVLIIAFLALNIYLGYQLWQRSEVLPFMSVSSEEVEQVMRQLEENNYSMTASLPRQPERMSLLSVEALVYDEEETARAFFPEERDLSSLRREEDGEVIYAQEGEILIFKGRGRLIYRLPDPLDSETDLEEDQLFQKAQEFLAPFGILPEDAVFDTLYTSGEGKTVAAYYQSYNELSLYSSYVQVLFQDGMPTGLEMYWLEPLEFSGENRYVIPITQALLYFLDIEGPAREQETIVSVDLGYYSREYDAQKWDMAPVWRILTARGRVVYINAYSGDEEKS